jgi:alpha-1,3-glucan synthase
MQEHPCYTLLLDKWMDGDPENNDYFSLTHEWGLHEITLRAGGDTAGLMSNRSLDYLQSMGYTCIYMAGTPFLNMPWQADSTYTPQSR